MEKANTNNVVNLNEFHERKRKTSRLTDEERDLVTAKDSKHPVYHKDKKATETEYHENPELVTRHIQDVMEHNGYPAEAIENVTVSYDDLSEDMPDLKPSEMSLLLLHIYGEFMNVPYEEAQQRASIATEADIERARTQEDKPLKSQAGKASLRLVHSTNDTPPNTASRSRAHLYPVDDSEY